MLASVGMAEQRRGKLEAVNGREVFNDLIETPITIQLGSYRAEWLYWGVLGGRWWRNYLHAHSFFEVCFAFRGHGSFLIQGRKHPVQRGDLFVARPLAPHEIISGRKHPLEIHFWAFTLVAHASGQQPPTPAGAAIDELLGNFIASNRCVARGGD